jgi:peptide/nickel transport system substrate-binding protein
VALAALVLAGCSGDQPPARSATVRTAPVEAPAGVWAPTTAVTSSLPDPKAPPNWLVWVHDREPPDLHADDPLNGTDMAAWVQQGLLEGLFGVDSNLAYYRELLASEPVVAKQGSGLVTISYTLRDGLSWSDGQPLTAEDVAFTQQIIAEGCQTEPDGSIADGTDEGCRYSMTSRIGYELVTGIAVTSPTTFTVTFAAFFAGWRNLYDRVLARHAFGSDASSVNANLRQWTSDAGVLPSSGPLQFSTWVAGDHLDLVRNNRYHGSVSPEVANKGRAVIDGVRIVFVGDVDTRVALLEQGRAQVVLGPLDPALAALASDDNFKVAIRPGGVFEHLGLNLLNKHLARPGVREAVAYALDKGEIVGQLYAPLVGEALPPGGLGNSYWMPMQPAYQDHQARYGANDLAGAAAALEAAGYVKGADGVYAHPVDGRLTLRLGTTGGNGLRDRQLELIRAQLARAGIEVVIDSFPGGLFYDQGPFSPGALAASATAGTQGDPALWDMAVWSWATGPWPGGVSGIFKRESDSNPYGFANPTFDADAAHCETVIDDAERAGCYDDVDTYATTLDKGQDGLFVLPITQRPRFYGYDKSTLSSAAIAPDLVPGGPLVNVGDFRFN